MELLRKQIISAGKTVDNMVFLSLFICSLPPSFDMTIKALQTRHTDENPLKYEEVKAIILSEYQDNVIHNQDHEGNRSSGAWSRENFTSSC